MKALKVVLSTVLTVAVMGVQVLAAGGSPVAGDGPKVIKAVLGDGTDVTGFIVTTYMGTTSPYDGVNKALASASTDIKAASEKAINLKGSDGNTLESKIQSTATKQVSGVNAADMTMGQIFDTSYIEGGDVKKLGQSITITYEYSIPAGSALVVIHQTADGVWAVVEDAKFGDGTVTVTSDGLSPFAFLVGKAASGSKDDGKKDDGKKSPQTGEYVTEAVLGGAAVLMLGGLVCIVLSKKKSSAK